ncbi:hypothetical protein [Geothrix fermentans]|nr:hypothetical protein [Geothrix fermentans]
MVLHVLLEESERLVIPLALFELVLAFWLLIRGLGAPATTEP